MFEIVTPEKVVYRDEVESVTLPAEDGEITVLPNHAPLVTLLKAGALTVKKKGQEVFMAVSSGFIEVQPGSRLMVLADTAERAEELTLAAVEAARERAQALLSEKRQKDEFGYQAAVAVLEREMARVKVARRHHAGRGMTREIMSGE